MTVASSLAFPGSRTLAGWWRQLAPLQPRSFWVAHLRLHRIEALVSTFWSCPLEPLYRFLLLAVAAEVKLQGGGLGFLERLDAQLHLGRPLLLQLLRHASRQGLVEGATGDSWTLTP